MHAGDNGNWTVVSVCDVYASCRQRPWACRSACACIMVLSTGGGVGGIGDGTVT